MTVKSMKAIIVTGSARYEKPLSMNYFHSKIRDICTETMVQLDSEQYILDKGFKKVSILRAVAIPGIGPLKSNLKEE